MTSANFTSTIPLVSTMPLSDVRLLPAAPPKEPATRQLVLVSGVHRLARPSYNLEDIASYNADHTVLTPSNDASARLYTHRLLISTSTATLIPDPGSEISAGIPEPKKLDEPTEFEVSTLEAELAEYLSRLDANLPSITHGLNIGFPETSSEYVADILSSIMPGPPSELGVRKSAHSWFHIARVRANRIRKGAWKIHWRTSGSYHGGLTARGFEECSQAEWKAWFDAFNSK